LALWAIGGDTVAVLASLPRLNFPRDETLLAFAPYVGHRFNEGPRVVFYGKATGGWGNKKPVPRHITAALLNHVAHDCVIDPPHWRFWTFLDEATRVVLRSLGYSEGSDWTERHPFVAWSNYLKIGENSVDAPGLALYRAQRQLAEKLMVRELARWKPRVVITVTNLDYGPTTAAIFGEDRLWRRRPVDDLWARDADLPGRNRARIFWSCHPRSISNERRARILHAIANDLRQHPLPSR